MSVSPTGPTRPTGPNPSTYDEADRAIPYGGKDIEVILVDGSNETVKVRTPSLRELLYGEYISLQNSPVRLAAYVTGKDEDWVDRLKDSSLAAILRADEEINLPRCARWTSEMSRRAESLQEILGNVQETVDLGQAGAMLEKAGNLIESLTALGASQPTPPSSAAEASSEP